MSLLDFQDRISSYLERLLDEKIDIQYVGPIDKGDYKEGDLKEFGYGKNLLIEIKAGDQKRDFIISTMNKDIFQHQFFYDRAKSLLFAHSAYNNLPKHARSVDLGFFTELNEFKSAGNAKEFFILREKVEGDLYFEDLDRIAGKNEFYDQDKKRAKTLALYLAKIHSKKKESKSLYQRRIRELIGHGECIMGLTDSYSKDSNFTSYKELKEIEKRCIDWRYRIKNKKDRLSQIHGDFHPWNILFREGLDFSVIDRSRGEWGEAADDVASLSINYLFFALHNKNQSGRKNLYHLYKLFWETYLEKTRDYDILSIITPFYVWRSLVLASPIWYPDLSYEIRRKVFDFIDELLNQDPFKIESALNLIK